MALTFSLNGHQRTVEDVPQGSSLLNVLREDLGPDRTISLKDGCAPQGQCGCCLVLIDGKPQVSCAMPAEKVDGKSLLTLEGVPHEEKRLYGEAFARTGGLQCGFCIPGIVLRAKHVLDNNPNPTDAELRKKLDVHLCRCTGYQRIIEAIQLVAAVKRGEAMPPADTSGKVGTNLDRYEGIELALGERPYVDDMYPEGMLHGAVRLSDHARARVVKIDATKALAMPGVERVVTYKDVPGDRFYGLIVPDWPGFIAEGEVTHCVGSFIAAVAADDLRTARAAAAAIEIEYEVLEPVLDPEKALEEDAPKVHRRGNKLSHSRIERGDVEKALAEATHVATGVYETQRIEHGYLEPESALVVPQDGGTLKLYSQGQGIFDDQRQVASFLDMSTDQVQVALVPNGGAFGGKEDMSVQPHAALLAKVTGKPVKVTLTREQSIRVHPKRHPIKMYYTAGCDADGRILAIKAKMIGDTGAYASVGAKVLERAGGHACGPYRVDNVLVEATAAYTNNPPAGAMRGFGANQANFGLESIIDQLAEKCGKDKWQFRYDNAVQVGDIFSTGQVLEKSVGIKKTLEAVKPHYDDAKARGRAVGLGCGIKNSGIGNGASEWGKCRLVVEDDGTISLYNGYTEMGQGLLTILIQFACDVTGLSPDLFRAKVDTTFALQCGQTTGSRATLFGGNAVILAAEDMKKALEAVNGDLDQLKGRVFVGEFLCNDTVPLGAPVENPKTHTAFGYATQLVILDEKGQLEKVVAAHDVGKAINPVLCSGQIEGSLHMGLGYALSEELPCGDDGMPENMTMRGLGILRARHTPPMEIILVEEHEPEGPYGAKGVGEIGLVPTAGAVQGALYDFDGERRYVLPMKTSPAAAPIVGRRASKR
ncbi:MAG: selenium-dependent xanthine dehydrogenase [Deltaproteobacteria bacterium]|jgi:selenium-dependent xanthine dehydrogenase